jgi:hypothetical protein
MRTRAILPALAMLAALVASPSVRADQVCKYVYQCTKYYPNGKDCLQTVKKCEPQHHCHPPKQKKVCAKVGVGPNGPMCEFTVETTQDCHK